VTAGTASLVGQRQYFARLSDTRQPRFTKERLIDSVIESRSSDTRGDCRSAPVGDPQPTQPQHRPAGWVLIKLSDHHGAHACHQNRLKDSRETRRRWITAPTVGLPPWVCPVRPPQSLWLHRERVCVEGAGEMTPRCDVSSRRSRTAAGSEVVAPSPRPLVREASRGSGMAATAALPSAQPAAHTGEAKTSQLPIDSDSGRVLAPPSIETFRGRSSCRWT